MCSVRGTGATHGNSSRPISSPALSTFAARRVGFQPPPFEERMTPAVPFAKGALSSLGKAWSSNSLTRPVACAATRSVSQQRRRMPKRANRPTLGDYSWRQWRLWRASHIFLHCYQLDCNRRVVVDSATGSRINRKAPGHWQRRSRRALQLHLQRRSAVARPLERAGSTWAARLELAGCIVCGGLHQCAGRCNREVPVAPRGTRN